MTDDVLSRIRAASVRLKVCALGIVLTVIAAGAVILYPDQSYGDEYLFPEMHIDTIGGKKIDSKEQYVDCTVSVEEDGVVTLNDATAGIRGRGNSTWAQTSWWDMPKKPYKIKFDVPTELFGHGAYQKWNLIADYADESLSRNYMAYSLGAAIGIEGVSSVQHVNLFVNGIYQGVYLLCDQIEPGPDRVDIDDDPSSPDFGFIVEMNGLAAEEGIYGFDTFDIGDHTYTIKSPDTSLVWGDTQFEYVRSTMQEVNDALESGDWSRVEAVIDTQSFAKTYVIEELMHDIDINWSSFFFHKDRGGKVTSGPIWDYDISSGNIGILGQNSPEELYIAHKSDWYRMFLSYPEFKDLVGVVVSTYSETLRNTIDGCEDYLRGYADDFRRNFERWPTMGSLVASNPEEFLFMRTWDDHLTFVVNWLEDSLDNLIEEYPAP